MPHTVSYDKIEKVDHIHIRFDRLGDMKVVATVRLVGKEGRSRRYTQEAKVRPGQRDAVLGIIRDLGAELDVDVPDYAKEKSK